MFKRVNERKQDSLIRCALIDNIWCVFCDDGEDTCTSCDNFYDQTGGCVGID